MRGSGQTPTGGVLKVGGPYERPSVETTGAPEIGSDELRRRMQLQNFKKIGTGCPLHLRIFLSRKKTELALWLRDLSTKNNFKPAPVRWRYFPRPGRRDPSKGGVRARAAGALGPRERARSPRDAPSRADATTPAPTATTAEQRTLGAKRRRAA